eukprot:scaffold15965_cov111-Isochrysis_galbana.AAC.3
MGAVPWPSSLYVSSRFESPSALPRRRFFPPLPAACTARRGGCQRTAKRRVPSDWRALHVGVPLFFTMTRTWTRASGWRAGSLLRRANLADSRVFD